MCRYEKGYVSLFNNLLISGESDSQRYKFSAKQQQGTNDFFSWSLVYKSDIEMRISSSWIYCIPGYIY